MNFDLCFWRKRKISACERERVKERVRVKCLQEKPMAHGNKNINNYLSLPSPISNKEIIIVHKKLKNFDRKMPARSIILLVIAGGK